MKNSINENMKVGDKITVSRSFSSLEESNYVRIGSIVYEILVVSKKEVTEFGYKEIK